MSRSRDLHERNCARFAGWARVLTARNQTPVCLVTVAIGSDPPEVHTYWPDDALTADEQAAFLASIAARYAAGDYLTGEAVP